MTVFRLTREEFARDLSGEGARRNGYRWNSKGNPMVYTSSSRALAVLEVLVHISASVLPDNLVIVSIDFPEELINTELTEKELPKDWRELPFPVSTQYIGDGFLQKREHLGLKVPSGIIPEEINILFNPLHSDMNSLSIKSIDPFSFDKRLFIR
jgi:RES domain-containing protein